MTRATRLQYARSYTRLKNGLTYLAVERVGRTEGRARLACLEARLEPTDVMEVLGHVCRQHRTDDGLARLLELWAYTTHALYE